MRDVKICWLDTETTGLSPYKNDIIQLAGMIDINGVVLEELNFACQPHDFNEVSKSACAVHGITLEMMQDFEKPIKTWNKFCRILDSRVDRYDKRDKLILAGYNVGFDKDFLVSWWKKCEQSYWGSYFEYKVFDVYPLVFMFATHFNWDVPDHKLETICNYLGIEINAHDAMADIVATRDVYQRLLHALPAEFIPNFGE